MELSNDMWVYGVWHVQGDKCDWLASLWRKGDKAYLEYRFRYYRDDKTHNSEDEKIWHDAEGPADKIEVAAAALRDVAKCVAKDWNSTVDFIDLQCQGGDPKVMFELGSQPWTNMRLVEWPRGEWVDVKKADKPPENG